MYITLYEEAGTRTKLDPEDVVEVTYDILTVTLRVKTKRDGYVVRHNASVSELNRVMGRLNKYRHEKLEITYPVRPEHVNSIVYKRNGTLVITDKAGKVVLDAPSQLPRARHITATVRALGNNEALFAIEDGTPEPYITLQYRNGIRHDIIPALVQRIVVRGEEMCVETDSSAVVLPYTPEELTRVSALLPGVPVDKPTPAEPEVTAE